MEVTSWSTASLMFLVDCKRDGLYLKQSKNDEISARFSVSCCIKSPSRISTIMKHMTVYFNKIWSKVLRGFESSPIHGTWECRTSQDIAGFHASRVLKHASRNHTLQPMSLTFQSKSSMCTYNTMKTHFLFLFFRFGTTYFPHLKWWTFSSIKKDKPI